MNNLSEEQQVRLAQRLGLIQHLPSGTFDGTKKKRECVICMMDFVVDDPIRFLPCLHIYHKACIDDWLLRSFTCPSCMEPVDAALISTFYTTEWNIGKCYCFIFKPWKVKTNRIYASDYTRNHAQNRLNPVISLVICDVMTNLDHGSLGRGNPAVPVPC